jgi:opacity protein-like surface antigen
MGAQIEGWYSRLKFPAQAWTIRAAGFSATTQLDASRQDTYTGAFNLMLRLPAGAIEPYMGVGAALLHMPGSGFDNPTPGLNVLAGLQVHLAERVIAFGEFKYSRFRLDGTEDGVRATMTYQPMAVVAGLSVEFGEK